MDEFSRASSRTARRQARESTSGRMVRSTMESSRMMIATALERSSTLTANDSRAAGKTEISTAKERTFSRTASFTSSFTTTARKWAKERSSVEQAPAPHKSSRTIILWPRRQLRDISGSQTWARHCRRDPEARLRGLMASAPARERQEELGTTRRRLTGTMKASTLPTPADSGPMRVEALTKASTIGRVAASIAA